MARQKPLFRRLFIPYVTVALATLVLLVFFIGTTFRRAELRQLEMSIGHRVSLILPRVSAQYFDSPPQILDSLLREFAQAGSFRLTLIDHEGRVLGETDTIASSMPNLRNRPEMMQALLGRTGVASRKSPVFGYTYSYVAKPIYRSGEVVAVLRGGERIVASRWELLKRTGGLITISIFLVVLGVFLIYRMVRRVSIPIETLRQGANRFAQGKLDERLDESDTTELASLSQALNHMAAQLDDRLHTVERQREEQEAVLAAMLEGVLAVDRDGQVIMINSAAARLFDVDRARAKGRTIEEAVRSTDIQQFVHFTLKAGQRVEREIIRYESQDRILQLRGTPILDAGVVAGVVVVINDVTQMRRLEQTRRDFVANASHELKTPVTAIKGSIETLREGAMHNPKDADRFLEMIARQADYLQSIIEDLLSLARIEQASESNKLAAEDQTIEPILREAIEATGSAADSRGQKIELRCAADLHANVNGFLIRQAMINLIDNACKYSPEGTRIVVEAKSETKQLVLSVTDEGPGIAEKHLSRIFERFYRVEASRNRKYGGTGLGLAIVKHAALAHGGSAEVDTQLGRGSTFYIRVPIERS